MTQSYQGVVYEKVGDDYFAKRRLARYAGVFSLWALGVGAVISGHFSGWNLGLAYGWGAMFVATIIVTVMYVGLAFSLAEMSPAMPHAGGAYSFARSAMGPWGGFVTGIAQTIEYVLTPAVVVFFIGLYLGAVMETGPEHQPLYWLAVYAVFVAANMFGVELSFRLTALVTLIALGCLLFFFLLALPNFDFAQWALNIDTGPDGVLVYLPGGGGPRFPAGVDGVLAALPFAVWLYLAIEQVPLAAEETRDPRSDLPIGILLGTLTLIVSAFAVVVLNASLAPGSFGLKGSGGPLLDGYRALFGPDIAQNLAWVAIAGLAATLHAVIYACGRQIFALSRAGYYPRGLSLTHRTSHAPQIALLTGAGIGLGVMLVLWFAYGPQKGAALIGGALLNMAVFAAMISYVLQAVSFILLRINMPLIERPFRSPLGIPGAAMTLVIALLTLYVQGRSPEFLEPMLLVGATYVLMLLYFAVYGRTQLVLSPEEEFAISEGRT